VSEEHDAPVGCKRAFIVAAHCQQGVKLRTIMTAVHTEANEDQFFVRPVVKNV
jgi:hypothetical protein